MKQIGLNRRRMVLGAATALAAVPLARAADGPTVETFTQQAERTMITVTFTKAKPPSWLLAFWKEIDDKTWGEGFNCFTEDAIAHLGVSNWHGREAIRQNLRAFVDKGFTAQHDVVEYWDGGYLKVFRGFVTMKPNDPGRKTVTPAMTHFFYMDEKDPTKVARWYGSVGPVEF